MTTNPYERFRTSELILRDELAVDRTILANERTLLAYIRTGLGGGVTGAGALHLFTSSIAMMVGWSLIVLALGVVAVGVWRFRRVTRQVLTCRREPRTG
jgi:putative membrane protein